MTMKTILSLILITACTLSGVAQDKAQEKNAATDQPVYTIVEQMPVYPGGDEAMKKYLTENIVYADQARKDKISGTVYVTFVVNEKGELQDVKVIRGVSPELDAEALRVVKSMPAWTPGKQSGKAVSVQYNLPIKFLL